MPWLIQMIEEYRLRESREPDSPESNLVGDNFLFVPAMFPRPLRENIINQKSDTLIVRWVEPKHPIKNLRGFLEFAKTPKAKPESVHAPKVGPIIYVSPRKDTVKAFEQRQFSHPETYFVVPGRVPRPLAEGQVTEVSVGVQAAEIRFAEFHQDLLRGLDVP